MGEGHKLARHAMGEDRLMISDDAMVFPRADGSRMH